MEFELKKVMTPASENREQYIGRLGFFSDAISDLKLLVSEGDMDYALRLSEVGNPLRTEYTYLADNGGVSRYFYPLPDNETMLVPFDDTDELSRWFVRHFGGDESKCYCPMIWVLNRNTKRAYLITGYLPRASTADDVGGVILNGKLVPLHTLFHNYELLDGTPISKDA